MKKITAIIALIAIFLMGINNVNGNPRLISLKQQKVQIGNLINASDCIIIEKTTVEVIYTITNENEILIQEVVTENNKLKHFVYSQLQNKKIIGNNIELKNQKINLVFKPEKYINYVIY